MYLLDSDHAFLNATPELEIERSEQTKPSKSHLSDLGIPGRDFEEDHRIAAHDSLNAAAWLRRVPALNRRQDVGALVDLLRRIVPHPIPPANWTQAQALAAMRDVGLVLGSIRRHGEEPLEHWPELANWLLAVGRQTGYPPRDTLLHYTIWNPDSALRTYTDLPEEVELIRAVKIAFPALEEAIARLQPLFEISIRSADFGEQCAWVEASLLGLRRAAIHTYQKVDRRVFIDEIRPYFEPITIRDASYLGPGAVAMPLFVFDHLLWSASLEDAKYTAFKADYLPVTLPYLRCLYDKHLKEGSLLDRILVQLQATGSIQTTTQRNLAMLQRLFKLLNGFRSVHLRMAQQAYEQGNGPFVKGSGGYSPKMLEHIFELSRRAQERFAEGCQPF